MAKKADDDKIFAFLGAFLTIIGFIIVLLAKRDSKYAMHYGKQGLVLGIAWIVIWIVMAIIGGIVSVFTIGAAAAGGVVVGAGLGLLVTLIGAILGIGLLILWIISWVNALSGEMKPLPLLGGIADKINL